MRERCYIPFFIPINLALGAHKFDEAVVRDQQLRSGRFVELSVDNVTNAGYQTQARRQQPTPSTPDKTEQTSKQPSRQTAATSSAAALTLVCPSQASSALSSIHYP